MVCVCDADELALLLGGRLVGDGDEEAVAAVVVEESAGDASCARTPAD